MAKKSPVLEDGFFAEVDKANRNEWYRTIEEFSDSNIYQTWDYDAVRCGEGNISHVVVRSAGRIVSAAQARIIRVPLLGLGAAYVRWGPLWQQRNGVPDTSAFRLGLRALKNEYVLRRGMILRVFPALYGESFAWATDVLRQEGFYPVSGEDRGRTFVLEISQPINELRKKLDQKWRNCLNKAERNRLEIIEGTEDSLFGEFIEIYRALLERKKFAEPNDINEFRTIQRELRNEHKMRIFLCRSAPGSSSAGVICSAVGETGVYLFGATNNEGMTNKASYQLQWKAIEWMKQNGCRYYNLNGINPLKNPGSYHFKAGLSGKNGEDVCYLGRFDCYANAIAGRLASTADSLVALKKRAQAKLKKFRRV